MKQSPGGGVTLHASGLRSDGGGKQSVAENKYKSNI